MDALTPESWARLEEIFDGAWRLPPTERPAWIARATAGDPVLAARVHDLLAAAPRARTVIADAIGRAAEQLADDLAPARALPPMLERRLGPYRILEALGEGGMGTVYLAERVDDAYRTQVAIKILRGIERADSAARLRDERQILATLEHPGIVRLLDGGSTDEGLPYLVLERIEGVAITRHCDAAELAIRDRLALFIRVCEAVAYAHGKLVVHRDLTPSNILVTREGVPKLLDFGIAKLLDHTTDVGREARTGTGMLLLTLAYASPEQVRGAAASTASDIYSLGAVLYELCTGRTTHELRAGGILALREILEVEPPRASTVAPAGRQRALAGDVDNILMKALHKEPARRYRSALHLAEDLRRHLDGLPVEARPATFRYRAGKLIARHRGITLAVATLVLALIAATAISLWQARRADEQAGRADAEAARARRHFDDVRRLASSLLFEVDDQIRDLEGATAARELIVARALDYLDKLAAEAGGDPDLTRELATAYMKIGDIQGNELAPNLGRPRDGLASYAKATQYLDALLAAAPADRDTQNALARAAYGRGLIQWSARDRRAASAELVDANRRMELLPEREAFDYRLVTQGYLSLAQVQYLDGSSDAQASADRAVEVAEAWQRAAPAPEVAYFISTAEQVRAFVRGERGDPDGALVDLRAADATLAQLVRDHPDKTPYRYELALGWIRIAGHLAGICDSGGWIPTTPDLPTAEALVDRAIGVADRELARDTLDTRASMSMMYYAALGGAVRVDDDPRGAVTYFDRARAAFDHLSPAIRAAGSAAEFEVLLRCTSPVALARVGRGAEARAEMTRGLALLTSATPPGGGDPIEQQIGLASCRYQQARMERALGDTAAASGVLVGVTADLEAVLATKPFMIEPYIGLAETLALRAAIEPNERCALAAQALAGWRGWTGPPTTYVRRRDAELQAAVRRCAAR